MSVTVAPFSTVMVAGVLPPSSPMLISPPVETTLPSLSTGPASIVPPSTVALPMTNSATELPLAKVLPLTTVNSLIVPALTRPRLLWPVRASTPPASICRSAPGDSCFSSVAVSVLPSVISISPAICWIGYSFVLVPTVVSLVISSVALLLTSASELTSTATLPVVRTNGLLVPSGPPAALMPMIDGGGRPRHDAAGPGRRGLPDAGRVVPDRVDHIGGQQRVPVAAGGQGEAVRRECAGGYRGDRVGPDVVGAG